jgi:uncharacterized membrane protein
MASRVSTGWFNRPAACGARLLPEPRHFVTDIQQIPPTLPTRARVGFGDDFRRFFLRGLAAVLPTLITILLVIKVWEVLWEYLGQHIIWLIKTVHARLQPNSTLGLGFSPWVVELFGVLLAIILVYVVGLIVGNFIGRTARRLLEVGVMRIPFIRAIYPAVKQVTDFLLSERKSQLQSSRVVAIRPHADNIWSVGLITGPGIQALAESVGAEMVTVFIPSSPTAFSGYVVIVPRDRIVELPLTVEEAMRLLLTAGVAASGAEKMPVLFPMPRRVDSPSPVL